MKKLLVLLAVLSLTTNVYSAADIIWTKTKDITDLGIEVDDYSPAQDFELKSYPMLVLKSGTYYCFAMSDKGEMKQLYGRQKVDLYQDGSTIEVRYFDKTSGRLLKNTVTEDGYWLDSKGKIIDAMGCARDYTTEGFKFLKTNSELTYMDKEKRTPSSSWVAISPLKNNIYYWYYFDQSGKLETNNSKVQGKYEVNKDGQYLENGQPVCFYLADNEETLDLNQMPEFVDKAGLKQDAMIITPKDTLGIQGISNATIYASQSKMQQFLSYVDMNKAKNVDFDILDRNFWDPTETKDEDGNIVTDNKGIIKNTIKMNGNNSTFSFSCKKFNYLKLKYCIDTSNDLRLSDYTNNKDNIAVFKIYVDGEQVWYDDDLLRVMNPVTTAEIDTGKELSANSIILFEYTSNSTTINLDLTVEVMKKVKYNE